MSRTPSLVELPSPSPSPSGVLGLRDEPFDELRIAAGLLEERLHKHGVPRQCVAIELLANERRIALVGWRRELAHREHLYTRNRSLSVNT